MFSRFGISLPDNIPHARAFSVGYDVRIFSQRASSFTEMSCCVFQGYEKQRGYVSQT